MIRVAVCDDEVKFTGKFENMLADIARKEHIEIEIEVLLGGEELVKSVCVENKRFDLIFLDIEMSDMDGLNAARELRKCDKVALLIYVTSHKSYAIEAYEVHPFQFLVKPLDEQTLRRYFIKAYEKIVAEPSYFQYKYGRDTYWLLLNEILYFKSEKRLVFIAMLDGRVYKYYDKLNDVERRLKQEKLDFWRIHQSYLVNSRYIARMSYDQIELVNKERLYISEDRRKAIGELYCDSIGGKIIE